MTEPAKKLDLLMSTNKQINTNFWFDESLDDVQERIKL